MMGAGLKPVDSRTCPRKLSRGQVRRTTGRGVLVGYFLACPGCGFIASYLAEEAAFEERRDEAGDPWLIGIGRPPPCLRCRKPIRLAEDRLEVP